MENLPWVRVVIVNYNGGEYLKKAVECLVSQKDTNFEAVIVDNASTDNSIDQLQISDDRFSIIRSEKNFGFAAGNNLGFKNAQTPWLATLNPDAFPEPNWLAALHRAVIKYPDTVMFGSLQINAKDPSRLDGCGDAYSFFGFAWQGGHGQLLRNEIQDSECFSPCAAAALCRRNELEAVGGFDERFFCYFEDVDLGFRLRLHGERCILVSDAVVHHIGSATTGDNSPFTMFHCTRNRLWTYIKNMPPILLYITIPIHIAGLIYLARNTKIQNPLIKGLKAAIINIKQVLSDRKHMQNNRSTSTAAIAKAMSGNMNKILRKKIDLRTL